MENAMLRQDASEEAARESDQVRWLNAHDKCLDEFPKTKNFIESFVSGRGDEELISDFLGWLVNCEPEKLVDSIQEVCQGREIAAVLTPYFDSFTKEIAEERADKEIYG